MNDVEHCTLLKVFMNVMTCFMFGKMMEQLTSFYTKEYPNVLQNRGHYNVIGRKVYMMYPSVKREGKKPWSALKCILVGELGLKGACLLLCFKINSKICIVEVAFSQLAITCVTYVNRQ